MLLFHSRQQSVINTTLPEERIRPAFAGVDLDRPLQSHAVSRLAQQRQQHDGQRAEQKYPVSARRTFDANLAQPHPKSVVLDVPKTCLYPPTFSVHRQGLGGTQIRAIAGQEPSLLHATFLAAIDPRHRVTRLGHVDVFKGASSAAWCEPLTGGEHLIALVTNQDISFKTNEIGKIQLCFEQGKHPSGAKTTVSHNGGKDTLWQARLEMGKQATLMGITVAFEQGFLVRLPQQRGIATMAGLHADNQSTVVIGIELGPVHGDDELGALADNVRYPVIEQFPDVELGVCEQAVDLLDGMLAGDAAGGN